MSIPPPLETLIHQRQFWTDWVWDSSSLFSLFPDDQSYPSEYEQLANAIIEFPVSFDAGLVLTIRQMFVAPNVSLDFISPCHSDTLPLAWDDLACSHLCCLRWDELDLIVRATMLAGADWEAIHLPLLLLHRFAPVCDDDSAAIAYPLLKAAWKRLGVVPPADYRRFIRRMDDRQSEMRWKCQEGFGWWLQETSTLRSPTPWDYNGLKNWTGVFPSNDWSALLSSAEETWNAAVDQVAQLNEQAELHSACQELLDTKDIRWAATIADGLQSAGLCERAFINGLQNCNDIVDICWILDALLGKERGSALRRHLNGAVPPFRAKESVDVEIVMFDEASNLSTLTREEIDQLAIKIRGKLRKREIGDVVSAGGGGSSVIEKRVVKETRSIEVELHRDFDRGLSIIRDHLANHGLADRSTIRTYPQTS